MCWYFTTLAGKQWHCLSVFRSSKEWSQHVTKDILQVFVQAVIRFPHSRAEKIREGCLISTISTCMRKHHCCKCFSEVAHHEDGAVKTMQWKLALRCRGIIWERCCSMLLLASFYTAACKLCMVYTLSPLAFRPASDKSSSLSSRNLSAMLWPSLLIWPGDPTKNEATLCLSHMRLFWERNFKVATGHTQPENSHLFRRAFCLTIRAVKLTV